MLLNHITCFLYLTQLHIENYRNTECQAVIMPVTAPCIVCALWTAARAPALAPIGLTAATRTTYGQAQKEAALVYISLPSWFQALLVLRVPAVPVSAYIQLQVLCAVSWI